MPESGSIALSRQTQSPLYEFLHFQEKKEELQAFFKEEEGGKLTELVAVRGGQIHS